MAGVINVCLDELDDDDDDDDRSVFNVVLPASLYLCVCECVFSQLLLLLLLLSLSSLGSVLQTTLSGAENMHLQTWGLEQTTFCFVFVAAVVAVVAVAWFQ